jgi:hypothetical protein
MNPFGNFILSEHVPKDELWIVVPGEQLQFLRPGEEMFDYCVEQVERQDGIMELLLIRRQNGTIIETKKSQIHKIINIGGGK